MLAIITVCCIALVALGVVVVITLRDHTKSTRQLSNEVRELRLTSRARVGNYSVQSGEVSTEQQLERLGRASVGKRVVFGGDDESELNQQLGRGLNDE